MEDLRGQFYERYRKEAEGYDKEFLKKHDEDLNTTLIFLRRVHRSETRVLTRIVGRSVLRRSLCLHYRCQFPAPTRPERSDRRPPPGPHLQDRQHWQRRSCSPAVDWPPTHDR